MLKNLLQHFSQVTLMHTQLWWPDGDTTPGGTELEDLFTILGLYYTGLLQKINRVSVLVIPLQTSYFILSMKSIRLLKVQNVWKFVQYSLRFLKHLTKYGMMV